jgi:hypothetical protein
MRIMIRIQIKVKSRIRIRINVNSRIRIPIEMESQIRVPISRVAGRHTFPCRSTLHTGALNKVGFSAGQVVLNVPVPGKVVDD